MVFNVQPRRPLSSLPYYPMSSVSAGADWDAPTSRFELARRVVRLIACRRSLYESYLLC